MIKEGYKMTEIGEIPEDCEITNLGNVLSLIKNGVTYKQNKKDRGYAVTRIETISEEKIDPTKVGYIDNIKTENINDYKLIDGDILFSHINNLEHIGKTAMYEGKPELLIHGMNLLLLRSDKSKIEPYYLLYLLKFYRAKGFFKSIAKRAVNQASINQTELKRIKISLAPLPEQKKIAEILSTADNAIDNVNEQIILTEKLKKGLMQKLLTRGIGHNKFKMTEIGEIPEDWEIKNIKDICSIIKGTEPGSKIYNNSGKGYKFIRVSDISKKILKSVFVDYNPNKLMFCDKNDILPVLDGVPGVVAKGFEGTISSGIRIIKPKTNEMCNNFIFYILQHREVQRIIEDYTKGTTIKHAGQAVNYINIPLPPLPEQQKIAEILSTVDKKLEILIKKKESLDKLKKWLMDNLLTGKIRVKINAK